MERAICFCHFSSDRKEGFRKVLGRRLERHPFVISHLFDHERDWKARVTPDAPFLFISASSVSTVTIPDWRLLLVSDEADVKPFLPELFDAETSVMYHTMDDARVKLITNTRIVKTRRRGEHEPSESKGYFLINNLIDAYDADSKTFDTQKFDQAMDTLFAWFRFDPELEAKLELLHRCLSEPPQMLDHELKEYEAPFHEFKVSAAQSGSDADYFAALTELRKSLLGS